ALQELLRRNDPRLAQLRSADQIIARVAEGVARGETQKIHVADAAAFLRAALPIAAAPDAKLILGVVHEQRGLEWVIAPPQPSQKAEERKPREPGAPTLRNKP